MLALQERARLEAAGRLRLTAMHRRVFEPPHARAGTCASEAGPYRVIVVHAPTESWMDLTPSKKRMPFRPAGGARGAAADRARWRVRRRAGHADTPPPRMHAKYGPPPTYPARRTRTSCGAARPACASGTSSSPPRTSCLRAQGRPVMMMASRDGVCQRQAASTRMPADSTALAECATRARCRRLWQPPSSRLRSVPAAARSHEHRHGGDTHTRFPVTAPPHT